MMLSTLRILMMPLCLFIAKVTGAACQLPQQPILPSGPLASEAEIRAGNINVKAFVADILDYRRCIEKALQAKGDAPSKAEQMEWQKHYNHSVDLEEQVVNGFNLQLRLFKARHGQ